ncbi:hypothetical protein A3762_12560 [Oleiphilus sp. HI0125]|uniref:hypothetical protein n=1 Tax=Oleiphilus sp. HI0125 TaxID=1822266 RepID=UPI0007C37528|nr:hypothetical protein [Oleiphilus sp. HI0125]KZZ63265.1 hypothetical protein A3762_12560 [Oleiphilus sp. HI0125]
MKASRITWIVLLVVAIAVTLTEALYFYTLYGVWHYGEKQFWFIYIYVSLVLMLLLALKPKAFPIITILVAPLLAQIILKCEIFLLLPVVSKTLESQAAMLALSGFIWVALYFYYFFQFYKNAKHLIFAYAALVACLLPIAHSGAQDIGFRETMNPLTSLACIAQGNLGLDLAVLGRS